MTGTQGVLRAAAERGLVNVPELIVRLKATNFYVDEALLTSAFGTFDSEGRRKEGFVGIAGFVAVPWRRRSDMRWHTLSQHVYPLAVDIGLPLTREPEVPERRLVTVGPL